MRRQSRIALACLLGMTILSFGALRSAVGKPNTVSIALPGDLTYRFKDGPGADRANTYCLTCHSSAYVSTQPPLDRDHWAAEVAKMRKAYGAEIPDKDADTITDYLTRTYGKS